MEREGLCEGAARAKRDATPIQHPPRSSLFFYHLARRRRAVDGPAARPARGWRHPQGDGAQGQLHVERGREGGRARARDEKARRKEWAPLQPLFSRQPFRPRAGPPADAGASLPPRRQTRRAAPPSRLQRSGPIHTTPSPLPLHPCHNPFHLSLARTRLEKGTTPPRPPTDTPSTRTHHSSHAWLQTHTHTSSPLSLSIFSTNPPPPHPRDTTPSSQPDVPSSKTTAGARSPRPRSGERRSPPWGERGGGGSEGCEKRARESGARVRTCRARARPGREESELSQFSTPWRPPPPPAAPRTAGRQARAAQATPRRPRLEARGDTKTRLLAWGRRHGVSPSSGRRLPRRHPATPPACSGLGGGGEWRATPGEARRRP